MTAQLDPANPAQSRTCRFSQLRKLSSLYSLLKSRCFGYLVVLVSSKSLLQLSHSVSRRFPASCRAAFLSHVLPKSHPKRIPSVLQLILPPCSPTPCHSSPLCFHLTSFHFPALLPSPFPTNPLLLTLQTL